VEAQVGVPRYPRSTYADWSAASLPGANQRRVRTAYPVTRATPTPRTPRSHPPPARGAGLPAGIIAAVVVALWSLQTMVTVVWWLCFSFPSVAVMTALPQKLPLATKVPTALSLLPTVAQWSAPVSTLPALAGLTLKHTLWPTGLGSPVVFGSLKTTWQSPFLDTCPGSQSTCSCLCCRDEDCGRFAVALA
jgi:hypothetical protein